MSIQQRSQLKGFGQSTNEKYMVLDINDIVSTINNLPSSAPKMYIAGLNQIGTDAPVPFTIYSDFEPINIVRNGVGVYTFIFDPGILNEKTVVSIFLNGSAPFPNAAILAIWVEPTNNTVYVKTYNTSGASADALLSGSRLQIQVYE
jgi:hypothetical protein